MAGRPPGASIDAAGNLFVATGNSKQTSTPDHSESVIRLSPSLVEGSFWTASDWANMNRGDLDTGSFGPLQLTNAQFSQYNGLVFQAAKSGRGWILNGANLGSCSNPVKSEAVPVQFGGRHARGACQALEKASSAPHNFPVCAAPAAARLPP